MKILKRGTPPADARWLGDCHSCKSELEATRAELRVEHDPRDHLAFGHAPCPVCQADVVFSPKIRPREGS